MSFDATEFLDGLSSDPAGSVASAVADPVGGDGGRRSVADPPIHASKRESVQLDACQVENKGRRIACTGRGAAERGETGGDSVQAIRPPIAVDGDDADAVNLRRDAVDRAALEYLRGERFGGPITTERVRAEAVEVAGVRVPAGWSVDHWAAELRRMASRCERVRPDRARVLRADADRLAKRA